MTDDIIYPKKKDTFNFENDDLDELKKEDLESYINTKDEFQSDEESEIDDFDIQIEEVSRTPTLRPMTPIKKIKEDYDEDEFPEIPLPNVRLLSPLPEYTDNESINNRVRELISKRSPHDYEKENEKVKDACMEAFEIKYKSLSLNNKKYDINFPEGKSLNIIHNLYNDWLKHIYVDMNLPRSRIIYFFGLYLFEFFCIRIFGIPMAGFAKAEVKRMARYDMLLIELGESMYSTGGEGGEPEPIEWRIGKTFLFNVLIFLAVKLITQYMFSDNEKINEEIRKMLEKTCEVVTTDDIEKGNIDNNDNSQSIENMLGNFLGGSDINSNSIFDSLSNLANQFTSKEERKAKREQKKKDRKNKKISFEN